MMDIKYIKLFKIVKSKYFEKLCIENYNLSNRKTFQVSIV